jgi:hypothetical protein
MNHPFPVLVPGIAKVGVSVEDFDRLIVYAQDIHVIEEELTLRRPFRNNLFPWRRDWFLWLGLYTLTNRDIRAPTIMIIHRVEPLQALAIRQELEVVDFVLFVLLVTRGPLARIIEITIPVLTSVLISFGIGVLWRTSAMVAISISSSIGVLWRTTIASFG